MIRVTPTSPTDEDEALPDHILFCGESMKFEQETRLAGGAQCPHLRPRCLATGGCTPLNFSPAGLDPSVATR